MKIPTFARIAFCFAMFAGCADSPELVAEEPAIATGKADGVEYDNWTYFRGVRVDARKCMYPMCGGAFVSRVNQPKAKCIDGEWAKDCYVAAFDFSAMGIEGEAALELNELARAGQLVVRGEIKAGLMRDFPEIPVFLATEAWKAATDKKPSGIFHRAHDRGIMCITWPCVSTDLTRLNRNASPLTRVAGVDLTPSGASDEQIGDAWQAMYDDAILVAGKLGKTTGPGGTAETFVAAQYYTRVVVDDDRIGPGCQIGGCSGQICASAAAELPFTTCEMRPEYACYQQLGVCEDLGGGCGWTMTDTLTECLDAAQRDPEQSSF